MLPTTSQPVNFKWFSPFYEVESESEEYFDTVSEHVFEHIEEAHPEPVTEAHSEPVAEAHAVLVKEVYALHIAQADLVNEVQFANSYNNKFAYDKDMSPS